MNEGAAQPDDGADRPDQDLSQRDDVGAEVAECATAGELALEAPGERHVGITAGIQDEAALKGPDIAEHTLS